MENGENESVKDYSVRKSGLGRRRFLVCDKNKIGMLSTFRHISSSEIL